jgi:hypothetical protein
MRTVQAESYNLIDLTDEAYNRVFAEALGNLGDAFLIPTDVDPDHGAFWSVIIQVPRQESDLL